jgi:hypothetical protein
MARRYYKKDNKMFYIVAVILALVVFDVVHVDGISGILDPYLKPQGGSSGGTDGNDPSPGRSTTLYAIVKNKMSPLEGTTVTLSGSNVQAEIWDNFNKQWLTSTAVDSAPDSFANMPNSLAGYLMVGNDDFVLATAGAKSEMYLTKHPFEYSNIGEYHIGDVLVYNESTPTWTAYDDGSVDSTLLNLTMASGETSTKGSLKFQAGADSCLGNPALSKPLAVCFYSSNATTVSIIESIKPSAYVNTIDYPDVFDNTTMNNWGECYVIDTPALCDYQSKVIDLIIDTKGSNNLCDGDQLYAMLLDKTYFKGDDGKWHEGFYFNSDQSTDTDVGFDSDVASGIIQIGFA